MPIPAKKKMGGGGGGNSEDITIVRFSRGSVLFKEKSERA